MLIYDSVMLQEGRRAWESPGVIEIRALLTSLLTEDVVRSIAQPILTETRARVLFEEVILKEAALSMETASKSALARESFDAYLLLKEHKAVLRENSFYLSAEASALKRWSLSYELLLKEEGFRCPSNIYSLVTERIESGEIKLEGEVIFAGFEDISPALAALVSALEEKSVSVANWPEFAQGDEAELASLLKDVELYAYPDMREEVVQAARFARERAADGKKTGIIVTNLSQYKELIEREFSSELSPASALLDNALAVSETFNISMAAPLSKSPIVKSALEVLTITKPSRPMETELMWDIFRSPYLNMSKEEYFSLARADAKLRRFNRSEISLSGLARFIDTEDFDSLKGFKERLDRFINSLKPQNKGNSRETPSVWAGRFYLDLKGLGWPGSIAELTSREFQAFEAFNKILSEFSALDDIVPLLNRDDGFKRLERMAEASTHQPKSPETLIEVIGIGESVGFEFDTIRIIGAYDDVLPPGIDPNPFIPINMQRELGLTRAIPELESRRAKERLVRLLKGAGEVVVSYPEMIEGREVRVSPFFSSIAVAGEAENRESNSFRDHVLSSSLLEDVGQESQVGFAPGEKDELSGGTSIIKDQSACPFKAFGTHRLGARIVESPEPGLSYMDRGSIVHSALNIFWKEVKDSEALHELILADKLIAQIRLSVDAALEPYNKRSFGEENYLNIEKERLRRLLKEWLNFEAGRTPFVVQRLESEDKRVVSGLEIKFRIDRVDSIAKLGHVLIDYKTGKCSRNDWLGARPKDPQMLFYNLFGPYEALAFASIKLGECKMDGIAAAPGMLPGNKGFDKEGKISRALAKEGIDCYSDLSDSWTKVVESLASDFVDGLSVVDPNVLSGTKACVYSYCDLKPLCRIFEADLGQGDGL